MAVPKKRTSRARRNNRRAHHRIEIGSSTRCSNCTLLRHTHSVCSCGFYRGKQILKPKIKKTKEE